jgi:hypothetical protein
MIFYGNWVWNVEGDLMVLDVSVVGKRKWKF